MELQPVGLVRPVACQVVSAGMDAEGVPEQVEGVGVVVEFAFALAREDSGEEFRGRVVVTAGDRHHHLATDIRPQRQAGGIVICDRYPPSSLSCSAWTAWTGTRSGSSTRAQNLRTWRSY